MIKTLKNIKDLFVYFMYSYISELEDVATKNGKQKRLRNKELEQQLSDTIKEYIKVEDLEIELKLGPHYNRKESPWIQIFTKENKSGAKGRYVGISFSKETNEVEMWIGFGRTRKNQSEILELEKEYKMKYFLIEAKLKYGFAFNTKHGEAIIIIKNTNIANFEEEEFKRDLKYITDLYKTYEVRFENAKFQEKENQEIESIEEKKITNEEINQRMIMLVEEVGKLAKEINKLNSKNNI
ncbi:MAG: hypothetical protein HFJ51_05880 [Clostridia bacterium]|nr:hypothetical protein [Clostridia bacterium]